LIKKRHIIFVILFCSIFFSGEATDLLGIDPIKKIHRRREKLSWIFGAGWNVVDDNGSPFKKLFAFKSSWNIRWYPTQASAEIIGKYGFTFGTVFNFNKYTAGKTINSKEITGNYLFFSLDGFAKYHLKEHVPMNPRLDPYVPIGFGYTYRFIVPYNSTATFNLGLGINVWLNSRIGLNLQSVAKFGMRSPFYHNGSNYLQHSGGIVFIWDRTARKKHSFIKPRYKWVHDQRSMGERKR
jgi:hypothetical protein